MNLAPATAKPTARITPAPAALARKGRPLRTWGGAFLPVFFCAGAAHNLPGWIFMWLLAASLFAGAKWITIADAQPGRRVPPGRLAAYLLLWTGLNLEEFCFEGGTSPQAAEWLAAAGKTVFGAGVVWGCLHLLPVRDSLLIGWCGMIGLVFVFHFGFAHLLSNLWRTEGFNAQPLMKNPIRAASLAEFWGSRWNTAFNDLMTSHVFNPLARKFGTTAAVLVVFLMSGLLHEIVISVPARGGFGWPTFYFAAQGAGLLAERSRLGRKIGLGRGPRGWLFTVILTGGLAWCLFRPVFIQNVILPMLRAIGAIEVKS
jgi:hypothetical protein